MLLIITILSVYSATNLITCRLVNPDIFESDDVAKSYPVSYRTINHGSTTCKFATTIACSVVHDLKTFYYRGAQGIRVNLDTIGCMWTGELDLNMLRVDGNFFIRKEKVADSRISRDVWMGLSGHSLLSCLICISCLQCNLLQKAIAILWQDVFVTILIRWDVQLETSAKNDKMSIELKSPSHSA